MTITTAIMAPVMVMTLAMGVEVSFWSVNQIELQRIADASAWAAATNYSFSGNTTTASAVASSVAALNGVASGSVSVSVVTGIKAASDKAFQVTVSRGVAKVFSLIFPSQTSTVTVSATAIAEYEIATSPQPCLLALATPATTATGISLSGSGSITSSGCSVVANSGISLTGASKIDADGTYAGTTITTTAGTSIIGGTIQNNGTLPDPYAQDSTLQNDLNNLTGGGTTVNLANGGSQTIGPGTYSSISVNGGATLTMQAGLYYVNGNLQLANGGTINGSGVTIIASGSFQLQGGGVMNVTPPQADSSSGIPGVIFASKTTQSGQIANGATPPSGGLIYYPNGAFSLAGSVPATLGCNEYIASTFTISGASNFSSSSCSKYGTLQFSSTPSSVALVE